MRCTAIAMGAGVVLAVAATSAAARAQDAGSPQVVEKEGWPVEVVKRPLTLARGMVEIVAPVGINLSSDRVGRPVFVAPSAYYGVTDALTVGVRHFLGACFGGGPNGCPNAYNDLGVDSVWRLWRFHGADLALGAGFDAAPIADPFTLSGEVRIIARWSGGPFALAIAPMLNVGLTDRSDPRALKRVSVGFPLATYSFGWVQDVPGNKEYLSLPATIQVQVIPQLALAVAGALNGPLDPPSGGFNDAYTVPFAVAAIVSPTSTVDVGASFTFVNLLGRDSPGAGRGEVRGLQLFAALRL